MTITVLKKNSWGETYASATRRVNTFEAYRSFCESMGYYQPLHDLEFDFKLGMDAVYIVPFNWAFDNGH